MRSNFSMSLIFSILCSVIVAVPTFAQGTDSSNLESKGLEELDVIDNHICLHTGQLVVRIDSNRVFCRQYSRNWVINRHATVLDQVSFLTYQNGWNNTDLWYKFDGFRYPQFLLYGHTKYIVTITAYDSGLKAVVLAKYYPEFFPDVQPNAETTGFFMVGRQFSRWGANSIIPRPDLLEEMSDNITLTLDLLEQYPLVRPSF